MEELFLSPERILPVSPHISNASILRASGKIVSPTIEQQLKAFDIAQVIAVLSADAAASSVSVKAGEHVSAAAERVRRHFRSYSHSQPSSLLQARAQEQGTTATRRRAAEPEHARLYPQLGVILGTVDRQGLNELAADPEVALICGTPQISLIRPERTQAIKAATGTTWGIEMLGIPALWKEGLTGKGIRVGHLDTGVDGRHPSLKRAISGFAEFEPVMGRRITPDPAPHDSDEHGTHTAGTVAGRETLGRRIGVAPGAELFSALVIEGGNVVARVLGGLNWAIANHVKIITMSLGFRGWWEDFIPIVGILRSKNILPVIAVGNEGPGTSRSPGNYPAILSVGAMDQARAVADFSSSQRFVRAEEPVVPDLVAPGVNVISAQPDNRFQAMDGTSMATPHIAGLAALLWESKPGATAAEIEAAIFESCALPATMNAERANRGMPNGPAALAALTGIIIQPGTPAVPKKKASRARPTRDRSGVERRAMKSRGKKRAVRKARG